MTDDSPEKRWIRPSSSRWRTTGAERRELRAALGRRGCKSEAAEKSASGKSLRLEPQPAKRTTESRYVDEPIQRTREIDACLRVGGSFKKSVALVPISPGLTRSRPAVAAGLVAAAVTFMKSATGAIIIFQGSMRTSAQNTNAFIGQKRRSACEPSSFHCNAQRADKTDPQTRPFFDQGTPSALAACGLLGKRLAKVRLD